MDRRYGGKASRDCRIHGRPSRENWRQRRYHRRSGRFGVSRRRLNRSGVEIQEFEDMVERKKVRTLSNMGGSEQSRFVVGRQGEHTLAVKTTERTPDIRPLSPFHGETPKSRHSLQSIDDGHEDRLERRAKHARNAKLVKLE